MRACWRRAEGPEDCKPADWRVAIENVQEALSHGATMGHIRCCDIVDKNAAGEVRLHDRQVAVAIAIRADRRQRLAAGKPPPAAD
jgi:hypothetical protein